jgi:small subunit ribosomal protein S6
VSTYEIVAVVRPDLDEEGLNAAIERIRQRIGEYGGTVQTTERWGKRKTAYPIQKHRDGHYVFTVFTIESSQVARLRQTLGLHEDLLRFTVASHHPLPAGSPAMAAAPTAAPAPAAAATPPAAPTPAAPTPPPAAADGTRPADPPEDSRV